MVLCSHIWCYIEYKQSFKVITVSRYAVTTQYQSKYWVFLHSLSMVKINASHKTFKNFMFPCIINDGIILCRFDNYFVAMVNKRLLSLHVKVPMLGEIPYLSKGLKYNLKLLLFS